MNSKKKNILIVTWYFYPELTPRAFRGFELTREFCKQGHKVKLVLPNKEIFKANERFLHKNLDTVIVGQTIPNRRINNTGLGLIKSRNKSSLRKIIPPMIKNKIKSYREFHESYFKPIFRKTYINDLYNYLLKETKPYDILISIGLPIETHIATAKAIRHNYYLEKTPITFADYGDPFSQSQIKRIFFFYYFVDLFIARTFKFIVVPTELAVKSCARFTSKKKIKVIPQGFNLDEIKVGNYKPRTIPTFAYAGCLYLGLRDPEKFLNYLKTLNYDYRFIFYTIRESRDTDIILKKHKDQLNKHLVIKYDIPRIKLITKLSTIDFLINFENKSTNQLPSKLIDYKIAKRPICSISTTNFNPMIFENFINGNYDGNIEFDINEYDIKHISNMLLKV